MPRRIAVRLTSMLVICFALSAAGFTTVAGAKDRAQSKRRVQEDVRFAAEMAGKGLWREALFRWRRALEARPDDPNLHNNVGVALEALGDLEEALAHYERALELAPDGRREELEANYVLARRAAKLSRSTDRLDDATAGKAEEASSDSTDEGAS